MFEAFNNFFDKIYVITLKRAGDRQEHIKKELQGLNYTFLYGADKKELDINQLINDKIYDPLLAQKKHARSRKLDPGEIGCSLSHVMVYQDIIANNYKKALILEDDVVIDKSTISLFDSITGELPADWQLLYLGYAKNENPPANAVIKKLFYHLLYTAGIKRKFSHTAINNLYPRPYSAHLQKAGLHDCTHAYAITNDAAAILLQNQTPLVYAADNLLAAVITNGLLKAYISKPTLINQQYQVNEGNTVSYLHQ